MTDPRNDERPGLAREWASVETCAWVLEQLPLLAGGHRGSGRPDPRLDAHLASCAECADELSFLRLAFETRPTPPPTLALRTLAEAIAERDARRQHTGAGEGVAPRVRVPSRWWTSPAAAAAVFVLAVGLGLVSRGLGSYGEDPFHAALDPAVFGWWQEDWVVAGAPYLDGLSDETLAVLAAGFGP